MKVCFGVTETSGRRATCGTRARDCPPFTTHGKATDGYVVKHVSSDSFLTLPREIECVKERNTKTGWRRPGREAL